MELRKIINSPIGTALLVVLVAFIIIVTISSAWEFISTTVFPDTTIGVYNRGFWENVLVELHGMLIELAVVGVLLLWLDGRREHASSVLQSKEELIDYAELDFPEAHLKKMGALKRLSIAGNTNFVVRDLHLVGRDLKGLKLKGCSVIGMRLTGGKVTSTTFESVEMRSSNFVDCKIKSTLFISGSVYKCNFQGATLIDVRFEGVDIKKAEFVNCIMTNTIFKNVSLAGVKFDGANLGRCSFLGAQDIDVAQLAKADNLDYISISTELLKELIAIRPDIKYQRSNRRP
ncbi:pentapeptide repeat-containing protein [Pseudomonas lurida]|uniref:pentapeptide repeat-containing protein n=1 Tax=Pseudomonas lurida TaxID=244566 RepID=UPI0037CBF7E8